MKNVILWGSGKYYEYKKPYLSKEYNIIGIINKNAQKIDGYEVIDKTQLAALDYDEIIIMSDIYMFEILKELLELGIPTNKIELGVNLPPATGKEILYISPEEKLEIREDGVILWNHQEEVTCLADIEKLKELHIGKISEETIRNMPLKPLSYNYGYSRMGGHSIARYYIDTFVEEHRDAIRGTVMEVGDARYSSLERNRIERQQILILDGRTEGDYVVGNLETGEGLKEGSLDCFILSSVLSSLFDVESAARNIGKSLKKGGKAIITVPGICFLGRIENETYGEFWRFTPSGLKKLLEKCIPGAKISMKEYGNAKTSVAFLYGLTVEDLTQEELAYRDSCYPLVIGACVER